MISYGDVALSLGDGELHGLIERGLDAIGRELREFQDPEWTGQESGWKQVDFAGRRHPQLYRLYWPRGASRWAEGHFLATEEELDAIRGKAYAPGETVGLKPLDLKIDDGTSSVTASMYMMPPRPLFQIDRDMTNGKNLYLLTLVDERYWWWRKIVAIKITPGATTWQQLYGMIGSALGITIQVDTIPDAYLSPPIQLQNLHFYIPPMLDAVAYSVGQRIVRYLDGTVFAQNAAQGLALQDEYYDLYAAYDNINFGGFFRFDKSIHRPDLPPLVPGNVRTVFPGLPVTSDINLSDPCDAERCIPFRKTYEKSLVTLDIAEYGNNKNVMTGYKLFHSTAIAWLASLTNMAAVDNAAILQALNDQLGRDWYLWQLASMSQVLAGIVPWYGEAASDYVEWEATPNKMRTFVMRETMNDLAFKVYHYTPNPGMSDPYPPPAPDTVPMACNGADEVPTTLHATFTYGTASLSLPLTYQGVAESTSWRYLDGGQILCAGLEIVEVHLRCDTTVWFLEFVTRNYLGGDGINETFQTYSDFGSTDLTVLLLNNTNPVDYTTETNTEYQTGCGLEKLYMKITGVAVP